jgi:hypothetical protein
MCIYDNEQHAQERDIYDDCEFHNSVLGDAAYHDGQHKERDKQHWETVFVSYYGANDGSFGVVYADGGSSWKIAFGVADSNSVVLVVGFIRVYI